MSHECYKIMDHVRQSLGTGRAADSKKKAPEEA
jgi:hypothetical protein